MYRHENSSVWKSVNLTLDRDFFILSGLQEWMVYEVKMQSYNDVGNSAFSPEQQERTRDASKKCCCLFKSMNKNMHKWSIIIFQVSHSVCIFIFLLIDNT